MIYWDIMISISIVMPVYNASNFLDKTVASVKNQTLTNIELICVDDGSTDNSLNILNDLAKENNFIKVYHQENKGSGPARNKGIEFSKGEFIAFLDADDIYLDKYALEKMYDLGLKYDGDIVSANLKKISKEGKIELKDESQGGKYKNFGNEIIIDSQSYGVPWAFYKNIYKRSFLIKNNIKFPNLLRGQDPIFLANALTLTHEIPVIDVDLYGYNYSVNGGVNYKINTYEKKRDYIKHFKMTFDILKNHNFLDSFSEYKKELINYLLFEENFFDEELIEILQNVFNDFERYFTEYDYGYYIMDTIINPLKNSEIDVKTNKMKLIKEFILNEKVETNSLKEFINTNPVENYKKSLIELKQWDAKKFNDKRNFLHSTGKLENEINALINSNNDILTSKSWKYSEFLRSSKNKLNK